MLVQTIKGLIPRDQLEVTDIVTEGQNDRTIATEWRFNGEIVKREVWTCLLSGQAIFGEQAEI
jgi:hypothetical protein